MPRYFFNYRDGVEYLDHDGVELRDIEEAKAMALRSSGEAIHDLGAKFWDDPIWETWVTDEGGSTVCALHFTVDDERP